MDRLDAMQVLLAVVDGGSLSAAGRKLNASLPSISRKVSELEHRLGARLLIRTTRNIELTDAGRDYVDAIRPIVAHLAEAERRASGEYHQPRGELSIIVPGEFGRLVAVPLIYEFLGEHRDISLNILKTGQHVDLIEQRADVAIRMGEVAGSSLYAVKVGEVAVLTVASPDYLERRGRPAHPADLADHDGIDFTVALAPWTYTVDGEPFECRPRICVRANSMHACIEACVRGFGIAAAGAYHIEQELRSGALIPILEDFETRSVPVHLIYVRQGLLPLKVRVFLDWMTPRLKQRLKQFNIIRSSS